METSLNILLCIENKFTNFSFLRKCERRKRQVLNRRGTPYAKLQGMRNQCLRRVVSETKEQRSKTSPKKVQKCCLKTIPYIKLQLSVHRVTNF
jgi:hypothetical protein